MVSLLGLVLVIRISIGICTASCHHGSGITAAMAGLHDLLSRSYVYHSVWSAITADNFKPTKHD